ncbi:MULTISPECIES: helix-turn-helix transcriptional regulator [Rhodomicrobium]|uniref:helix-turn-helix transcriptional regulator n=1 Tax=Rhodomicrobium TaxID=1068 RepID=UPI000B4BBA0A|nr:MULTISPECIES: helix-turn-helix transcriptional regulator [Rhodomicrobium]
MNDRPANGEQLFVAAVEAIYHAATAPDAWPRALEAIAEVFGDIGANLIYLRDGGAAGTVVSPSLIAGAAEYQELWWQHDIRTQRASERGYWLSEGIITDAHLVSEAEMNSHPFYTEFLAKYGLRWSASAAISPEPRVHVGLTVQRSAAKSAFTDEECAKLARLSHHAERSLRLSLQLMNADVANVGLRNALDGVGLAVFLLDGLRRVVFSNTAANRLIGRGLELFEERLTASMPSERDALEAALSASAGDSPQRFLQPPRPVLLKRPHSQYQLMLYPIPLHPAERAGATDFLVRARAIVIAIELRPNEPAEPALVRDLLGLTLGEARVAALIGSGVSPKAAAERLRIAEGTVRTVLKRVFLKAGVSRQSELAVLLTNMSRIQGR